MTHPTRNLTAADLEVLEFERARWKYQGRKQAVALERFGVMPPRYYQRLAAILDHPDAAAYNPQLVRQLRASRAQRSAHRAADRIEAH